MELVIHLLVGLGAVLLHCLRKLASLKRSAKALKIQFGLKEYLNEEWPTIMISIILVFMWPFLFEEAAQKYSYLEFWVTCSFAGIGFFGSYILQAVSGRGEKIIRNAISENTDKAEIANKMLQAEVPEDEFIGKRPNDR